MGSAVTEFYALFESSSSIQVETNRIHYTVIMKFTAIVCLFALVACAYAAPPASQQEAQVLRFDSDVQPEGYKFAVETSDGKSHREEGELKDVGTDHEAIVVRGSFSYVGDDGQTYVINYLADENGFQPEGAHLPRAVQ